MSDREVRQRYAENGLEHIESDWGRAMGEMFRGIDPFRFERLADGA